MAFSPQRKVLVRHLSLPFVTELDGYKTSVIPASEPGKGRVYQSPGGQLWTVVPGGLREYRAGNWVLHPLAELEEAGDTRMRVIDPIPLHPVRQGLVLFLLPERLMEFNSDNPDRRQTRVIRSASETGLEKFLGMAPARDGGLWISGARGLAKLPGPVRGLTPETEWRTFVLPESLGIRNLHAPVEDRPKQLSSDGSFYVVALAESSTNDTKVLVGFDGENWQVFKAGEHRVRQAWRGPEKSYWAISIDHLLQGQEQEPDLREVDDLSARQYFDVAVETGGAFWLATSEGLFRYAPLLWSCPRPLRHIAAPVRCLAGDAQGRLWFLVGNKLHAFQDGAIRDYSLPASHTSQQLRQVYALKNGALVLAFEDVEFAGSDQLFRLQPSTGEFLALRGAQRRLRVLGSLGDGSLCIQNLGGQGGPGTCALERYDGSGFESIADYSPTLAGTNLNVVFTAQNGDLWLGGELGAACLRQGSWRAFAATEKTAPDQALFFAEVSDGKIWCAAQDQIWEYDGQNWSPARTGFDSINSLKRTTDGSVWVASNSGLHRYFHGGWVEYRTDEGLPANTVRDLCENSQGVWAGTTRGLTLFHPEADPETDPPDTSITKVSGTYKSSEDAGPTTISFTGGDKWKHTPRERLLYSYRLDERDWSPFQESEHVSFSDLAPGKHYFQVRAMDRNCNVDLSAAYLDFSIVLPWYKETRLLLIAFAGAAAAIFFGALALNRHFQLLHSYAEVERKVAERTRQLEVASRELQHSQKMNALGTLAAGIAHDFNNILSIIKGSAQIIEDNLDNPEKIRTRADRIKTVVEQGAGIVKAMLGFSRESGPQPESCDLNAVAQDTLRLLGDRFLREVQVRFDPDRNLPQVATARDFIQQVLLNFIFNAAESMITNRQVILSTRLFSGLPQDLVLAPAAASSYIAVSVQDFGCGIPAENLPRIFEPFFTTKSLSARRGTGLGLSMVYELARKLEAGLAVKSALDQGSTFTLIIPVREAPASPEPHPSKG